MLGSKHLLYAPPRGGGSGASGRSLSNSADKETKHQKRRKMEELNKRYQGRVTLARLGKEAMAGRDYVNAIKYYNQYLRIMADIHQIEVYELGPALFGPKETSEKLMMSQIFWDLCKICDMSTHLRGELQKNLNMFVTFTINQPYQALNSEMLRKYFQKGRVRNVIPFQESFKKIQVSSKRCYVATFALGENHWATRELRDLKLFLLRHPYGPILVHYYYLFSSNTLRCLETRLWAQWLLKRLTTSPLKIVALFWRWIKD